MSKEQLEARLAELRRQLDQIQANGNATLGAIAECEYWLKQLEEAEGETKAKPEVTVKDKKE